MAGLKQAPEQTHELVLVGRITSVFGIKGWVNVFSYTDPAENILNYSTWLLSPIEADGQRRRQMMPKLAACKAVELGEGQRSGKKIIARLAGCDSRDAAVGFVGQDIFIPRNELPELEDEVYWIDLEGLQVINLQGQRLGVIHSMMATGANDVMVVQADSGEEHLIPYVEGHYVIDVQLHEGWIKVDWDLLD